MRAHKFHAIATIIDGIRFASKREGRRYQDLKLLVAAGEISLFTIQPVFRLFIVRLEDGEVIEVGKYTADFEYHDRGRRVVEDVKSDATKTTAYRLRKRMVEALYGIRITEVQ